MSAFVTKPVRRHDKPSQGAQTRFGSFSTHRHHG